MNEINKKQYLENPCGTAFIHYQKTVCISIPDNMKILHDKDCGFSLFPIKAQTTSCGRNSFAVGCYECCLIPFVDENGGIFFALV